MPLPVALVLRIGEMAEARVGAVTRVPVVMSQARSMCM